MPDVSYWMLKFLRQPSAALARRYLGIGDTTDTGSSTPGSGDVVGPASATAGNFASFGDVTGKLLADSGSTPANMPSASQKAALAGTSGAPAAGNPYVTDADARNTNSRTPTVHAASHQNGGGDEINVGGLSGTLADPQTPAAHESTHESGNSDALTGLIDANARIAVNKNSGATVGTRRRLNLIEGSNVTITVADDAGNEEVDVTIAASGGGSDWDTTIVKSADQTVTNNATPQNDSELSVAVATNTLYLVELLLLYAGNNTTGDYRGRFTFPDVTGGGTAMGWFNAFNTALSAAVITPVQAASTTAWPNGDMILGTTASSADFLACQVRFLLRTTGTAGTLQYQFANSAAALGRDSITKAGSTLRIKAFTP